MASFVCATPMLFGCRVDGTSAAGGKRIGRTTVRQQYQNGGFLCNIRHVAPFWDGAEVWQPRAGLRWEWDTANLEDIPVLVCAIWGVLPSSIQALQTKVTHAYSLALIYSKRGATAAVESLAKNMCPEYRKCLQNMLKTRATRSRIGSLHAV